MLVINDDIYSYLKTISINEDFSDNFVLNNVIENMMFSNFILIAHDKIVHTSKKYKKILGKNISKYLKEDINKNSTCSGRKSSIEVSEGRYLNGPVYYQTFIKDDKIGTLLFFYNPNLIQANNLSVLDNLIKYVFI